jgi:L-aspartate oxidase
MRMTCDFLVIGSGIAGLSFALEASEFGSVVVVTKRARDEANTTYAQGGIAAVLDARDSFEAHTADTLTAGAGLSHNRVVELCVTDGPSRIAMLRSIGARFDRAEGASRDNDLDLHLEGGHSARRVAHAADMTGREVERALLEAVAAKGNVQILEEHMAVDLITLAKFGGPEVCAGAYVLDVTEGRVKTVLARATVLASGGAGKVYLYTTNPDVATGDGVAIAYRAGAEIANMEFYQFHPTALFHPQAKTFLISEALRGEGAILRRMDGTPFMKGHDARAELAPRDIVARAIDYEMKTSGAEHVLLDITHKPASFIKERFPGIYAECKKFGIDICTEPMPVTTPAAGAPPYSRYMFHAANSPSSMKALPASTSFAIRSRAVSRPWRCCRSMPEGPPPCSIRAASARNWAMAPWRPDGAAEDAADMITGRIGRFRACR